MKSYLLDKKKNESRILKLEEKLEKIQQLDKEAMKDLREKSVHI